MPTLPLFAAAALLVAAGTSLSAQDRPRYAELGDCPTLRGEVVRECRIGYRTYGRLAPRRDNAVLVPTWYGGRSESMTFLLGPEGWLDTTRWFVVLMDALGDGVSTSPSNSRAQPGAVFPRLGLEDMVDAQHRAVTERLGIRRLHAVVGWSMGGMQAIVWGLRHPEAVDRVISVAGTPRMSSYDTYWVRSMLTLLRLAKEAGASRESLGLGLAEVWHTVATTPARENALPREQVDSALAAEVRQDWLAFDPEDNRLQLEALAALDAFPAAQGRGEGAGPRTLLLFVPEDHVTTPEPFREYAALTGADTVAFSSPCGHLAPVCETAAVGMHVRGYLDRPAPDGGARVGGNSRGR